MPSLVSLASQFLRELKKQPSPALDAWSRVDAGGWRVEGGGCTLAGGGWRVENRGWRVEGGGRRVKGGGVPIGQVARLARGCRCRCVEGVVAVGVGLALVADGYALSDVAVNTQGRVEKRAGRRGRERKKRGGGASCV